MTYFYFFFWCLEYPVIIISFKCSYNGIITEKDCKFRRLMKKNNLEIIYNFCKMIEKIVWSDIKVVHVIYIFFQSTFYTWILIQSVVATCWKSVYIQVLQNYFTLS